MDFAQLDLKTASEQGSWVHLTYNGKPLYDDDDEKKKPSRLHIRGVAEPKVMAAIRTVLRVESLKQDRLGRTADKDAEAVMLKFERSRKKQPANCSKLRLMIGRIFLGTASPWNLITKTS